ncbi:phosphoribosyl-ATP pyrophosphatase [Candidatus Carsonella ruddii]|uniref:Phosphoribosyl-ATP pyrophosphohydrolase n=1 Tax=Candidatus Carsonella ruddii HC isolate Thao2000 TaxID=1202538 RepID=J3TW22_CARRU|nr:phosphoribosyl-ATP pyrophosphohydrolase [Candidatus Carsonella ruddii]AFP83880.1 phosphoribosyl-ATP pyrophosphohydrolase [Candidatus Carsonella ruddii HC isolate Thao2000]
MIKILKLIKKKINVGKSYSLFILKNNLNFLIKKIFEELNEIYFSFINYKKNKNCFFKYDLLKEICDFIYHFNLFLIYNNISYFDIEKELLRRNKISGEKEKKNR